MWFVRSFAVCLFPSTSKETVETLIETREKVYNNYDDNASVSISHLSELSRSSLVPLHTEFEMKRVTTIPYDFSKNDSIE